MKPVPQLLREAADIYEQRNAIYKDNYKRFGAIFVQLMPGGVKLENEDDFNRFSLFVQVVAKMTRYCQNFDVGGHVDSLDDMVVYGMMLQEVDGETRERLSSSVAAMPHPVEPLMNVVIGSDGSSYGAPADQSMSHAISAEVSMSHAIGAAGGAYLPVAAAVKGKGLTTEERKELYDFVRMTLCEAESSVELVNHALLRKCNKAAGGASASVKHMLITLDNAALYGVIEDVMNDHSYNVIGGHEDNQCNWTYTGVVGEFPALFSGKIDA